MFLSAGIVRALEKWRLAFLFFIAILCFVSICRSQQPGKLLIDSLIAELPKLGQDTFAVNLLNRVGNAYGPGDPEKCKLYTMQGLNLARKLDWENGIGSAYNVLGICEMGNADFKKSMGFWTLAMERFQKTGNKRGLLKVIGNIGVVNVYQSQYTLALENYFTALQYAEELGDKRSVEINLSNISAAYEYLGDFNKALDYNFRTLRVDLELRDSAGIAVTLGNLGNIYSDLKQYDRQEKMLKLAIALDEKSGNEEGVVRGMLNMGSGYTDQGMFLKALKTLIRAKNRQDSAGITTIDPSVYFHIADALIGIIKDSVHNYYPELRMLEPLGTVPLEADRKGILNAVFKLLRKSIGTLTERSALSELAHTYATLSEAQRLSGDYKSSLESHTISTQLKDSVFSTESKIRVANLETRRELDLKDKQIIIDRLAVEKKRNERVLFAAGFLLLLVVVVIIVRNVRLSTAKELSENKLNAFQARMNPHFIFNSLSSIQSLILNNETEQSIDYLSEFALLMRQILDNSGQSKVTLKTEIDMLRSYIELEHLRFDGFRRNISVAADIDEEKLQVPGMIIQPFVENAILHGLVSKGSAGRLDIIFERSDKHVICTVEDNGVGREKSGEINRKRSKTRQSHGTAIATNRLTLLNDKKRGLVNKVVYIDKMENEAATGTKVIIQIPIL